MRPWLLVLLLARPAFAGLAQAPLAPLTPIAPICALQARVALPVQPQLAVETPVPAQLAAQSLQTGLAKTAPGQPQAALAVLDAAFSGSRVQAATPVSPVRALLSAPVFRLVKAVFGKKTPAPEPPQPPKGERLDPGELGRLTGATLSRVADGIYHLNFPTQHLLAATFLRFQEHYESPKFAGKAFTWKEFAAWYKAEYGKFSYFDDWSGFNIPSRVLASFYRGEFDPLTRKETSFLDLFRSVEGRFYIIGTYTEKVDEGTLRHEIAHGLYYRDEVYRARVQEILKALDLAPVFAYLTKIGYGPNVLLDEAHAYLGDDLAFLKKQGIDVRPYRKAHDALLALYRERSKR